MLLKTAVLVAALLCLCGVAEAQVTGAEQIEIENKHNEYRNGVKWAKNMEKMYWSAELATHAQNLADGCEFKHDKPSSNNFPSIGQNIAMYQNSWASVMFGWHYEEAYLDFGVGKKAGYEAKDVGHYTQMVWATSNNVGCGYNYCGGDELYVCNYGPAGNIRPNLYTPYQSGNEGESICGGDYKDSKYTTLCDTSGEACMNRGQIDLQRGECKCAAPLFSPTDSCQQPQCNQISSEHGGCINNGGTYGTDDQCAVWDFKYNYCPYTCGTC